LSLLPLAGLCLYYRSYKPAHPRGKPIVGNDVAYVKKNFFAGEVFISLEDCQQRATDWPTVHTRF